jgi:hypothetical protein
MSLDRHPAVGLNLPPGAEQSGTERSPRRHPLLTACYALIALSTGIVLALAPWLDTWNFNSLQSLNPTIEYLWDDPAFRTGLSALGGINLMIAFREFAGLFRATSRVQES